jgi:methionyl-tRNA formyltransferase
VLEKVRRVAPEAALQVFSFREDPWEPPFLDDIRNLAHSLGAEFHEAKSLNVPHMEWLQTANIDLILAVNWRYMIPPSVYQRARFGSFVFHDSLLPKYRGFAPTIWAIRNGEAATGVTLFEMAEKVDSGPIVDQIQVPIGPHETVTDVAERVTEAYLEMVERNLPRLIDGAAVKTPQDDSIATYACKLMPDDMEIDWAASTRDIYNMIRSYTTPYPGAYTLYEGKKVHVMGAKPVEEPLEYIGRIPGRAAEIIKGTGVRVITGDGEILLTRAKLDGETMPRCAAEIFNKMSVTIGRK